jgi:hypothetical protein
MLPVIGLVLLCNSRSSRKSGLSEKSETKQCDQEKTRKVFDTEAVLRRVFCQGAL